MTILYKLTNQDMQTFNGFQWVLGEPRQAPGGGGLCSDAWLHAYTDPILAILLNPIHADIKNPKLFRCEGEVCKTDHGLKVGCIKLTLLEELKIPKITTEQRVRFAILCAQKAMGTKCPEWSEWAAKWLSGENRTRESANAAWAVVARAMANESACSAAWPAAKWAAQAAAAMWAAEAAAAMWAAEAAVDWAAWTVESGTDLDLIALAYEACG
jgi:hypothetical protein